MKKLAWILVAGLLGGCAQDWSAGLGRDQAEGSEASLGGSPLVLGAASPAALTARSPRAFAGAPDRGSLASYPAEPVVRRSGAYTFHAAELSEEHALRATISGRLNFVAPDGSAIDLEYVRHVEHPDGNWSWIGRTPGEQGESTVLTFGEAAVFGTIPQKGDKPPLRLTVSDGRSWVVSADPRLLRGIRNEATHPTRPDYLVPPKTAAAVGSGMQAMAAPPLAAATVAGKTVVDVAVGFTGGFATARGGASAAVTRIRNLVDITNQAYINSGVNAEVRLVHTIQVSYPDATDNGVALEELTGFKPPSTKTTPAAAFSELRASRETYGADLVVLVRKFQDPENEGCGIAWLIGGERRGIASSDSYFGYSVVSDGQDAGADGKTYFCREETFAHELGHNMGSQHDSGNAMDDGKLKYGAYDYSFGYNNAGSGDFYTLMAYGESGQRTYRVFSNPDVTYCGGLACGIANQADNARSLNNTIPVIAKFRAAAIPASRFVRSDFDGDGKSDIYWRNGQTGANDQWIMNGFASTGISTVYREADTQWTVVGSGDFNGDLRADVFWRNLRTGDTYVHLMDGGRILTGSGSSASVPDLSWSIVAFGDFDGDGRTDVYWRNTKTGVNDVWLMDGARVRSVTSVYQEPNQAWEVVGAGDFNGDQFADILWRNTSTGQNYVHLMSGTTILPASGPLWTVVSQAWQVVAIGDFNGDGKADIYWRNSISGDNDLWSMNGTGVAAVNRVYSEPNAAWKIVASGDFNGDGKADVLWRNNLTGQNHMHLMNGAQILGDSGLHTVSDLNWRVVGR